METKLLTRMPNLKVLKLITKAVCKTDYGDSCLRCGLLKSEINNKKIKCKVYGEYYKTHKYK